MDGLPFVGRDRELSAGEATLLAAASGAGGVLVIEGEAGIGKTRLVAELVGIAQRQGFRVLSGGADELGVDRPFGPLVEALGPVAETAGVQDEAATVPGSDLGFAITHAIVATAEEMAADGAVLLVLEDLHWADPSTVRCVVALGRAAGAVPLVVALTARSFPRSGALDGAIEALVGAGARHLTLAALDADHAADLAHTAGLPSGDPVAPAGGNPLLIIELARAGTVLGTAELPATLRSAVKRRLRSLPAGTVEVLTVASVLGRRFRLDHLAAVTGRRPAQLAPLLSDALAAGVLGDTGGELAFRHDLIRDAIYLDLAEPLRQGLHRDVARVLAARRYPALVVAEHLVAGAGPGDAEAVDWLAGAAGGAASRSPLVAVRLLEHALGLADSPSARADELAAELAPLLVQVGRAADASAWLPLYHCVLAMRRLLGGAWDDALADVEAGMALA
ncbi:MAG: ATP-binding protein, partial [Acidimicrobiales bacterium]